MNRAEKLQDLIDRAKPFYDDDLPYHGWPHAEQVMRDSSRIIREMGHYSLHVDEGLVLVAAAWHDAGHEDAQADNFESREHYAVWLAKQHIGPDLGDDFEVIERAIMATRFGVERTQAEEIILHYADLANVGYEYDAFFECSTRLWREYGSPEWSKFVEKGSRVILQTADEAERELPLIGLPIDALSSFPARARANVARLQTEMGPR